MFHVKAVDTQSHTGVLEGNNNVSSQPPATTIAPATLPTKPDLKHRLAICPDWLFSKRVLWGIVILALIAFLSVAVYLLYDNYYASGE